MTRARLLPAAMAVAALSALATSAHLAAQSVPTFGLQPPTASSPWMFSEVASIRELSDGTLLVSDRREELLVALTWPDRTQRIGRLGQGPGEYRSTGRLIPLAGDSTLFLDPAGGRWMLLHGAEVVATLGVGQPAVAALGTQVVGADSLGRVLGTRGRVFSGRAPRIHGLADSLEVLRAHRATGVVERLATVRGFGSRGYAGLVQAASGRTPGRIVANNPLDAADEVLLFPDGWIAVAHVAPFSVDWIRPDGTWVRGPRLPAPDKELDRRDKCFAVTVARGLPRDDRCDADAYPGWPSRFPPFRRDFRGRLPLFALPGGQLAVARQPTPEAPEPRYDLVDRSGRLFGVLQLGPGEILLESGADAVYTLGTNEVGLQAIRRHSLPPALRR